MLQNVCDGRRAMDRGEDLIDPDSDPERGEQFCA
jgi:hypothetical protein